MDSATYVKEHLKSYLHKTGHRKLLHDLQQIHFPKNLGTAMYSDSVKCAPFVGIIQKDGIVLRIFKY